MASKKDRVLAGLGAVFFFALAGMGTVAAIIQTTQSSSSDSSQNSSTQTAADQCTDTQTEATLPVPEIYKPDGGSVTELQQTDLEPGDGAAAKDGDCLVVKYYGTLASDGTRFDDNFTATTGFPFVLGSGAVIKGWDQGLVGLKVGGTRRLVIPASLGYGAQASGSIPANSSLVFVVKLLRIK